MDRHRSRRLWLNIYCSLILFLSLFIGGRVAASVDDTESQGSTQAKRETTNYDRTSINWDRYENYLDRAGYGGGMMMMTPAALKKDPSKSALALLVFMFFLNLLSQVLTGMDLFPSGGDGGGGDPFSKRQRRSNEDNNVWLSSVPDLAYSLLSTYTEVANSNDSRCIQKLLCQFNDRAVQNSGLVGQSAAHLVSLILTSSLKSHSPKEYSSFLNAARKGRKGNGCKDYKNYCSKT